MSQTKQSRIRSKDNRKNRQKTVSHTLLVGHDLQLPLIAIGVAKETEMEIVTLIMVLSLYPSSSAPPQKVSCFLQNSWRVGWSSLMSPLPIRPVMRLLFSRTSIYWFQLAPSWLWWDPAALENQPWSHCCSGCTTVTLVRERLFCSDSFKNLWWQT